MTTKRKPKAKRKTKPYEWTNRDQLRAEKEGWAIFEAHGGQEIEADHDSRRFVRNGVAYDDKAVAHVCRRALAGSRMHVRALVIHLRDVIDIMKVAHGYDVDERMLENPDGSPMDELLTEMADASFACGEWTKDHEEEYEEVQDASARATAAVKAEIARREKVMREIRALTETPNSVNDALDSIRELARREVGDPT
jgi:hypothetical protein